MPSYIRCPICQTATCQKFGVPADAEGYDCPRCGRFVLSGTLNAVIESELNNRPQRRAILSHTIRRMQRRGVAPPFIDTSNAESYWLADRLPTPQRQADALVLLVGERQPSPDQRLELSAHELGAWVGTAISPQQDEAGIFWVLNYLAEEGLLEAEYHTTTIFVRLTMPGWERFADLQKVSSTSRTAFMAMKFGDPDLNKVVAECFKPAVARTAFELRLLTDQQPAGLIDDQIRASILSARFVVADLTHANPGAYWEAGFAEGLGIPVIYTCERSRWDESKTHFDTNHMVTIVWDLADLRTAENTMAATIRATFRADAKQED
jgi:hypothetical protein